MLLRLLSRFDDREALGFIYLLDMVREDTKKGKNLLHDDDSFSFSFSFVLFATWLLVVGVVVTSWLAWMLYGWTEGIAT